MCKAKPEKGGEIPYRRWADGGSIRLRVVAGESFLTTVTTSSPSQGGIWEKSKRYFHGLLTVRSNTGVILDSPAVAIWKYKDAEKYGSYEVISSDDMLVQSKTLVKGRKGRAEDEWVELSGSQGFLWITRCTTNLLDRPPLIMYRDGVTTEFSNMPADWGSSFIVGINDFIDGILEGRQVRQSGEEGKMVLQICRAIQLFRQRGTRSAPEEIV